MDYKENEMNFGSFDIKAYLEENIDEIDVNELIEFMQEIGVEFDYESIRKCDKRTILENFEKNFQESDIFKNFQEKLQEYFRENIEPHIIYFKEHELEVLKNMKKNLCESIESDEIPKEVIGNLVENFEKRIIELENKNELSEEKTPSKAVEEE